MMRVIDVAPNAIPNRAANQNIRKVMFLTSETSDADGAGNSVSGNLHQRASVIFVGYHRCQRPCCDAVSGWKGRSAGPEIAATFAGKRTAALSDFFQRGYHDRTINQRFSAEQASLASTVVMLGTSEQIES